MKIKSDHTKKHNYQFGLALLILVILFGIVFSQFTKPAKTNEMASPDQDSIITIKKYAPQLLELQINQENFKTIKQKREAALDKGLLFTSRLDLVPGDIRIDDDLYGVNVRLKGDLLDHLKGDKWSYRIEMKKSETWRSMSEFSIHNSQARSHVAEWLMLQIFELEGIITPQYDFITVEENGISKGVYAYEEHFTDELLIRNKKQIAPILKHNDDAYWENVQKDVKPFFWTKALDIDLFNKNNTGDPNFMESFEYAKSLLQQFLNHETSAEEIFDLNKMAKYYALMELSHAFHAQQITNIRFYLNPLSGKLEPIAFDCFGEELPAVSENWEAAGEGINPNVSPRNGYPYGGVYMHLLFQDVDFFTRYMTYLNRYTDPDYLSMISKTYKSAVEEREAFIKTDSDYKDYAFQFDEMFAKASYTRKKINPLPNYSLKVFTTHNSRRDLAIKSFHYFPMEIVGFGNESEMTDKLKRPIFIEAYNKSTVQRIYSVVNSKEKEFIYFRTIGTDILVGHKIEKNNLPNLNAQSINQDLSYWLSNEVLLLDHSTLTFKNQKTTLSEYLIIPKENHLIISPGQEIVFKGDAAIISFGNIKSKGAIDNRIKFTGDGNSNQGIVSNANSIFANTDFTSLSSVQYKGIYTKSGLSITSDCSLSNCFFDNSTGQYALSVDNANYEINNTSFLNCQGNGIEIFSSEGSINKLNLDDITGNGLFINRSKIDIKNAVIISSMGSALLASHSRHINIDSLSIQDSFQGIVSTDNTRINCSNATFTDLQNGLVIKAPESKGSLFIGESISFVNVKSQVVQDLFATISLNGKRISQ